MPRAACFRHPRATTHHRRASAAVVRPPPPDSTRLPPQVPRAPPRASPRPPQEAGSTVQVQYIRYSSSDSDTPMCMVAGKLREKQEKTHETAAAKRKSEHNNTTHCDDGRAPSCRRSRYERSRMVVTRPVYRTPPGACGRGIPPLQKPIEKNAPAPWPRAREARVSDRFSQQQPAPSLPLAPRHRDVATRRRGPRLAGTGRD